MLTSYFAKKSSAKPESVDASASSGDVVDLSGQVVDDDDGGGDVVFVKVSQTAGDDRLEPSMMHALSPPPPPKKRQRSSRSSSKSKASGTTTSPVFARASDSTKSAGESCPSNSWGALVDTRKRDLWAKPSEHPTTRSTSTSSTQDQAKQQRTNLAKTWVAQTIHRVTHTRMAPFTVGFVPSFETWFRTPGSGDFGFDEIRRKNQGNQFAGPTAPPAAPAAAAIAPETDANNSSSSNKSRSDCVRASNLRCILGTLRDAGAASACWCCVAPDQRSRAGLETMIGWCEHEHGVSPEKQRVRDASLDMIATALYHKQWWHRQDSTRGDDSEDIIGLLSSAGLVATAPSEHWDEHMHQTPALINEPLDDWVAFLSRLKVDQLKELAQDVVSRMHVESDSRRAFFNTSTSASCKCASEANARDRTKMSLITELLGVCSCDVAKADISAVSNSRRSALIGALGGQQSAIMMYRLQPYVFAMLLRAHTWVLGGSAYAPDEAVLLLKAGLRSFKFVAQPSTTMDGNIVRPDIIDVGQSTPGTRMTANEASTAKPGSSSLLAAESANRGIAAQVDVSVSSELDAFGVYLSALASFHELSDAIRCGRAHRVYRTLHEACSVLMDTVQAWQGDCKSDSNDEDGGGGGGGSQARMNSPSRAGNRNVPCSRCPSGHTVSSVAHVHLGGLTWWWRYLAIRWLCLTSLYGCQVLEREKRFDVARHYLECCHRATSRESAHQVFPLGGGGECDGCAAALAAWCHDATTRTRSRRPVSDVGGGGVDISQVPLVNEHNDNPMRHLHLAIALRLSRDHAHLGNKDTSLRCLEAALDQPHVLHHLPKLSKRRRGQQQQQQEGRSRQSHRATIFNGATTPAPPSEYRTTQNRVGGIGASLLRACLSQSVPPRRWVVKRARPLLETRVVRIKGVKLKQSGTVASFNLPSNNRNGNSTQRNVTQTTSSRDGAAWAMSSSTWSVPRVAGSASASTSTSASASNEGAGTSEGVEQFVLDCFMREGWVGMHCENGLLATLFVLLFADVLWEDGDSSSSYSSSRHSEARKNATPFLDMPRELLASVWFRNHVVGCSDTTACSRNLRTRQRVTEISTGHLQHAEPPQQQQQQQQQAREERNQGNGKYTGGGTAAVASHGVRALLRRNWARFHGMQLRGVNWKRNTLDELERIVECLFVTTPSDPNNNSNDRPMTRPGAPGAVLAVVAEAMLDDYCGWAGGLADLFLWRPSGVSPAEHLFAEVKGPGDSLSDRQRAWIDKLSAAGASVQVVHVDNIEAT